MSRMMAPKMEVIRFNETDVIVASGGVSATLNMSGWANQTKGDLSISYGGTPYGYNERNDFIALLTNNGKNDSYYNLTIDSGGTFGNLYERDYRSDGFNADGSKHFKNSIANGTYIWVPENNRWENQ